MDRLPERESTAMAVYRALLLTPGLPSAQVAAELDRPAGEVDEAVEQLVGLGLLAPDPEPAAGLPHVLRPVNPDLALRPLLQEAEREAAACDLALQSLRHDVAVLSEDYRGQREEAALSQLERLDGVEAVVSRLPELLDGVTSQVRSFVPVRPSYDSLAQAQRSDLELLARGVRVRTICLESVRSDRRFMAHLATFQRSGAETRTTATLPVRMLVLDDDVAVIAQDPADASMGAIVAHGKGLMAVVCALFEAQWQLANDPFDPFDGSCASAGAALSPGERGLVSLLAQGLKDETCARQLGVSVRTIRRMVADLTDRVGAGSRFELAVLAVQRGWV